MLWLVVLALVLSRRARSPRSRRARRATNIAALQAFPAFYHGRQIVLVGQVATENNGTIRATDGIASVHVVFKGSAPDGNDEIRGEFWDLGRMKSDDPRLANIDLRSTFGVDPDGAWPRPGDVTAIMATAIAPAERAPVSVDSRDRAQPVALRESEGHGQRSVHRSQPAGRSSRRAGAQPLGFRDSLGGRRPLGERRAAEGQGLRPRARRAAGHEPLARDHRRRARGTRAAVARGRRRRAFSWARRRRHRAPVEEAAPVRVPAAPPPEVVFSAPTQEETDVALHTSVRIQFSRDIKVVDVEGKHSRLLSRIGDGRARRARPRRPPSSRRSTTPRTASSN